MISQRQIAKSTNMKTRKIEIMDKQYWKHIICILVVKGILLTAMWYVFFRDEPKLNDKSAANHIFYGQ